MCISVCSSTQLYKPLRFQAVPLPLTLLLPVAEVLGDTFPAVAVAAAACRAFLHLDTDRLVTYTADTAAATMKGSMEAMPAAPSELRLDAAPPPEYVIVSLNAGCGGPSPR